MITHESCMARARVVRVIDGLNATFTHEDGLQVAVGEALTRAGIEHRREFPLGTAGRIDFLTADGVGIECKIAASITEVLPQLFRYLDAPACSNGVVLVTTKARHRVPIAGVPLSVVVLSGGIR